MEPIRLLIPLMPPPDRIAPWLERLHANRHYTNFGPLSRQLENDLRALLELPTDTGTATFCNATLALELALSALRLPPGSPVLVPALTFPATATAVIHAGHRPVFADIDARSWLMTPKIAEQALSDIEYAAAIPVAAFGAPQDERCWDTFSRRTNKPVVIDAAGAFGNQTSSAQCLTVFSLHATKALGCGEGGIAIGPADWIQRMRTESNFGIDAGPNIEYAGTNAKMSEYHAAVALAALGQWPETAARRRRLHAFYVERLATVPVALQFQERPLDGIYTIFPILLPPGTDPARFARNMAAAGVETRRWYHPLLPDHKAFESNQKASPLQTARNISARLIGLPFHPFLSEADIERIVDLLPASL